jgi:hypothetical protein
MTGLKSRLWLSAERLQCNSRGYALCATPLTQVAGERDGHK